LLAEEGSKECVVPVTRLLSNGIGLEGYEEGPLAMEGFQKVGGRISTGDSTTQGRGELIEDGCLQKEVARLVIQEVEHFVGEKVEYVAGRVGEVGNETGTRCAVRQVVQG